MNISTYIKERKLFEQLLALLKEGHEVTINEYEVEEYHAKLKSFIDSSLKGLVSRIREEIINLMEDTRTETGAFKYDACYEAVLSLLSEEK